MRAMLAACAMSLALALAGGEAAAGAIELDGTDRECRPLNFAGRSTVVTRWNVEALSAICEGRPKPTIVSRELFLLHAAIYDAWAAYDAIAAPLHAPAGAKRAGGEAEQTEAVSFAALTVLLELYPEHANAFFDQLRGAGFAIADYAEPPPRSPALVGVQAGDAALSHRAGDGANAAGGYADTSGYRAVNAAGPGGGAEHPNRWQPLIVSTFDPALRPPDLVLDPQLFDPGEYGHFDAQMPITPHWPRVEPFALAGADVLRPPPPPQYGNHQPYTDSLGRETTSHQAYVDQFTDVMVMQTMLSEEQKVMAQMWSHDGAYFATPAGHWNHFAQQVSLRDGHGIDDDVKLFLVLNGALLDAGIAAWDAKVAYDSVRPITAIRFLFAGQRIAGWRGPDRGFGTIRGEDWRPYQWVGFVTPAFPEYVSGHSAFAAAGAEVLLRFTGSDRFHDPRVRIGDLDGDHFRESVGTYRVGRRRGVFDRLAPRHQVTLIWRSFSEAAEQCGISRLYSGVHIMDANLRALEMGRAAGASAWRRAERLWSGG